MVLQWSLVLTVGLVFLVVGLLFLRWDPTRGARGSELPNARRNLQRLGFLVILCSLFLTTIGGFLTWFYATGPRRVPELGMVGKWKAEEMESVRIYHRNNWYRLTSPADRAAVAEVLNSLERHRPGDFREGYVDFEVFDTDGKRYHYDFSLLEDGNLTVMLPRSGVIMAQMTSPEVRKFLDDLLERQFTENEAGMLVPVESD